MNFRLFRKNPDFLGLAGVVSMTFVRGKHGAYTAGNLFLFPWLKPKGRVQKVAWPSVAPTDATQFFQASPIPNDYLPLDEHFVRVVLEAPSSNFIGFSLETPFDKGREKLPWVTNVKKLADGGPVGINWASSNLNRTWFGGSSSIPNTDTCNGMAWRKVIVDGLNQATVAALAQRIRPRQRGCARSGWRRAHRPAPALSSSARGSAPIPAPAGGLARSRRASSWW